MEGEGGGRHQRAALGGNRHVSEADSVADLIEACFDACALVAPGGRVASVNSAFRTLAGVRGMHDPSAVERFVELNRLAGEPWNGHGEPWEFSRRLVRLDGTEVRVRGRLVCRGEGSESLLVLREVTEVTDDDHAGKYWRSVVENPFDYVSLIDRSHRFTYVNHTAPGLVADEIVGKSSPLDFLAEEQRAQVGAIYERAFVEGRAEYYEAWSPRLERWFATVVGPVFDGDRVVAVSLQSRDITAARKSEAALEESERRLKIALEAANDGIFDIDLVKGQVFFSPRVYQLTGYSPQSAPPPSLDSFEERVHPEDLEHVLELLEIALRTGGLFNAEFRLSTPEGDYRWFHCRGGVLLARDRAQRFSGIITDISERKRSEAEREELASRLIQVQKMETLGALAGGIAHDFNNLLGPIIGFTELALMQLDEGALADDLSQVLSAALRAKELSTQILAFSRGGEAEFRSVRVQEIVLEVVKLLRGSLSAAVEVELALQGDAEPVHADPTQLHQLITNLCTNAFQAMRVEHLEATSALQLRITVDTVHIDKARSLEVGGVAPGVHVRIAVEDTGVGMSPEMQARIFEPFFTARAGGGGTGLGLAVVHGIVVRMGWGLSLRSTIGRGTTFEVFIPNHWVPVRTVKEAPPISVQPRGSETVLCVDDDRVLVSLFRKVLGRLGYRVTAPVSAEEAWRRFEEGPEEYDLVLTAQSMNGLGGIELASRMRSLRPEQRILLTTREGELLSRKAWDDPGIWTHVEKPISMQDLALIVRNLLDQGPAAAGRSLAAAGPNDAEGSQVIHAQSEP